MLSTMILGKRKRSNVSPQPTGVLESTAKDPHPFPHQPSTIDMLNTDCLLHIYKYLSPLDVAHASEASHHLNKFASENVYHKYAKINLFAHCLNAHTAQKEEEVVNCLLRHFGQHVTHCCLNAKRLKTRCNASVKHILAVLRNCPNLVHIRLENFDMSRHDIEALASKKMQASELHVSVRFTFFGELRRNFWNNWANLRSLTIKGIFGNVINLDSLHHLQKLSLENCNVQNLYGVLQSNGGTLKSLTLLGCCSRDFDLYDGLVDLVPNLEHLKIGMLKAFTISRLHEFKNIKYLQLYSSEVLSSRDIVSVTNLESMNTLQELDMMLCNLEQLKAAAKATSLRGLSIRKPTGYNIISGVLDETLPQLPNLRRLYLSEIDVWSTAETVKLLTLNRRLEEIVLFVDTPQKQTVHVLLKCLKEQPARPTVRLSQIYMADQICIEMDETDRKLLQDNSHLLKLHVEKAVFADENMEQDEGFVPTANFRCLDCDEFMDMDYEDFSDTQYDDLSN